MCSNDDGDLAFNSVDIHVGIRIRQRRIVLGMSQEKLAAALRLTFRQVQKYERGTNRVSASRLYELCRIFDVSPDYFFDELTNAGNASLASRNSASPAFQSKEGRADPAKKPTLPALNEAELLASFASITDSDIRRCIVELVKSISMKSG